MSLYCHYYQARLAMGKSHLFTAILKSFEHLCFDRTIDAKENIFEFFVPPGSESEFVTLMAHMKELGLVEETQCLPNRLRISIEQRESSSNSSV